MIETAIDYKTLYEESTLEIVSLKHEIANLKRMIFGSKSESFIPQNIASTQLSLDIQAETIATCSVIKAQKIEYTRNQVEIEEHKKMGGQAKIPRVMKEDAFDKFRAYLHS